MALTKSRQTKRTYIEPTHESLEAALAAGQACNKCIATLAGTKGCRECMGKWFEEICQSGAKSGPFKRVYSKTSGS